MTQNSTAQATIVATIATPLRMILFAACLNKRGTIGHPD